MNATKLAMAAVIGTVAAVSAIAAGAEQGGPGQGDGTALRAQLGWRTAEPVPAFTTRAPLAARPTLEELVAAGPKPAAASPPGAPTSRSVVPGESYPGKHGGLIRRYFELLRAREVPR